MAVFLQYRQSPPCQRAHVTLTRGSSREPDFEALVVSFKPVVDALVRAGVIQDDNPKVIGQPTYKWEPAGRGKGFIRVKVESIKVEEVA